MVLIVGLPNTAKWSKSVPVNRSWELWTLMHRLACKRVHLHIATEAQECHSFDTWLTLWMNASRNNSGPGEQQLCVVCWNIQPDWQSLKHRKMALLLICSILQATELHTLEWHCLAVSLAAFRAVDQPVQGFLCLQSARHTNRLWGERPWRTTRYHKLTLY